MSNHVYRPGQIVPVSGQYGTTEAGDLIDEVGRNWEAGKHHAPSLRGAH